ncbi:MAG: arsenate reductase (glutaredoxin) [Bacteroidota bacterium]|nr:arsenate reductase (glutaredoxin) [Bacteroidota bacterium]
MIEIYHNPKCSKSRQSVSYLEQKQVQFKTVLYLQETLTKEQITELLTKLQIPAEALVRKNEAIWKEKYKDKILSSEQIIDLMVMHPNLIERPIIVKGNRAVIGRPVENIDLLLD